MICKKPTTRATHEAMMQLVLEYIEKHLADLDVERLHEMTALSRFHFHRVFRELTGETPGLYVRRKRLNLAMALLKAGEMDLSVLARTACYTSLSAFNRAFRDQFGITPGTYAYQLQRQNSRSRIVPSVMLAKDYLTSSRFRFLSNSLLRQPPSL